MKPESSAITDRSYRGYEVSKKTATEVEKMDTMDRMDTMDELLCSTGFFPSILSILSILSIEMPGPRQDAHTRARQFSSPRSGSSAESARRPG